MDFPPKFGRSSELPPGAPRSGAGKWFTAQPLLALSRLPTLPTVWSNCVAGWWLGDGRRFPSLLWLLAGASLLYLGGSFLNDAFDTESDRVAGRTRPIPTGAIGREVVLVLGWGFLGLGVLVLFFGGGTAGALGLTLAACVVLYDLVHRILTFSPVILGVCRWLIYIIAASTATAGVTGWAIWCGFALGVYVTGAEYLRRFRRAARPAPLWQVGLLAAPIVLSLLMDTGDFRTPGLLLALILGLWLLRCLRHVFGPGERSLPAMALGLQAGIVLVDWLAVADAPRLLSAAFIALFLFTLLLQSLLPGD